MYFEHHNMLVNKGILLHIWHSFLHFWICFLSANKETVLQGQTPVYF